MAVTLKDIASECGLAVSTVSNILNNNKHSYASERVKQNVRDTAERLGYKKDYLSVSLRTKKTRSIGICVDRVQDETRSDFIREAVRVLNDLGYEVAITDHRFDPDRLIANVTSFRERYKDGMILFTDFLDSAQESSLERIRKVLKNVKIPLLSIGTELRGVLPSIDIDRTWAMGDVLSRFSHYRNEEILLVFKEMADFRGSASKIDELGITCFDKVYHPEDFILRWEKKPAREGIRAIFFRTDAIAIPALNYFAQTGVSVPEDLEVISFDNFHFSQYTRPALTTYALNFDKLGALAAQLMCDMLSGEQIIPRDFYRTIEPDLQVRSSHRS